MKFGIPRWEGGTDGGAAKPRLAAIDDLRRRHRQGDQMSVVPEIEIDAEPINYHLGPLFAAFRNETDETSFDETTEGTRHVSLVAIQALSER
jgi:hypothetical protein